MRTSMIFSVMVAVLAGQVSIASAARPTNVRAVAEPPASAAPVGIVQGIDPFAHVIGEHTTEYAVDRAHVGRAHNVALAASLLDGAVIEPGAILSFNERVGERTVEAGFAVAPELHDGHVHEGIGGGVCQVATTLHIAALESGLEIVEHRVHSVPSQYADPGLDATVYYGRIDFRVRNPYPFPLRVRASSSAEGTLSVRIEAGAPVAASTIETRTIRALERTEQTIEDATLASGERVIEERGRDGMVVRVRASREDGTRTERTLRYSSSPRIVRVGR